MIIGGRKYKWNFEKFICNMITMLSIAVMVWVGASYIDVLLNNEYYHREKASWNALQMMVDFHNQIEKGE